MQENARLVFAGILLVVLVNQLWIARVRSSGSSLYLAGAWTGAAFVMVAGRWVQHATDGPPTVLLGARIFHTGVLSLVPLGVALAYDFWQVPRGRWFWGVMVATSLPVPLIWISRWIISDRVRIFQTAWGPILGPEPTHIAALALPYLGVIAANLIFVAWRGRRDLPWHQRISLGVALFALLPALVNDVLLYSGMVATIEIVGAALFLHMVAINVGIFSRAGQLVTGLERTVGLRTEELLARERELSQLLTERRRILDAIPDVLCLLREGRIDYVNDAGERFFSRSRSELTGSAFAAYLTGGQVADAEQCLRAIEESPRPPAPVELRFVGASGERTAEVAGLSLELGDGPRMLVTVRDVTERKQLLAKLQVADRLASVGTLAAGIAHEINNPLTFVIGNLEFLKAEIKGSQHLALDDRRRDRSHHLLDDCLTGTMRIAQIVKDLRIFTRPDDEQAAVDCRSVLEYALKIAITTIRHKAEVTTDYHPTPLVRGDPRRLSQVFLNLLVNAFQSIPDDGGRHSIHVSTRTRADGWGEIEIADTGIGVDPALGAAVFDPFVTTKVVGQGTGLGLFICQSIVTELGGEIRLVPRKPAGTVARVSLPPADAALTPTRPPAPPARTRSSSSTIRVLIADDEEMVLRMLTRLLAHYEVTPVKDGVEAIRALETESFDVILCDLMMPRRNGAEVWSRAAELGVDGRFVLMTGGATTDYLREFVKRVRTVTKPVTLADLEAAFDGCLGPRSV